MKIYISGKIAGDPDYKGKFARAAAQLERLGATVINPATAPEGLTKLDYMRICFAEMKPARWCVMILTARRSSRRRWKTQMRCGGHLHRQDGSLGMTDKGGEDVGLEAGGGR